MPSFDEIKSMALALPEEARVKLADELYGSLDIDEIDRAWGEEAERRFAEIESGEAQTLSHEEVMAEVRARLRKK